MKKEREQKCIYDQIRNVYRMKLRSYIKNRNGKGFVVEQKEMWIKENNILGKISQEKNWKRE